LYTQVKFKQKKLVKKPDAVFAERQKKQRTWRCRRCVSGRGSPRLTKQKPKKTKKLVLNLALQTLCFRERQPPFNKTKTKKKQKSLS
jgi:hypothetical protein